MSSSGNNGCLVVLIFLIYAGAWIGAGTVAWNWVQPASFGGAILFILAWGLLGYIAQIIGGFIIAAISSMME